MQLKAQRDIAREQRDLARVQRDIARAQRDAAFTRLNGSGVYLEPDFAASNQDLKYFVVETEIARDVWDELNDENVRRDHSHWLGIGRWADEDSWRDIGRNTLRLYHQGRAFQGRVHD